MLLDMSKQDDYDLASAMRGPDYANTHAKYISTAVIRYFAGVPQHAPHCTVATPEQAKSDWSILTLPEQSDALVGLHHPHFWWHIERAFLVLIERDVEGAEEYFNWLCNMRAKGTPDLV